jgi:hypothetical protein
MCVTRARRRARSATHVRRLLGGVLSDRERRGSLYEGTTQIQQLVIARGLNRGEGVR